MNNLTLVEIEKKFRFFFQIRKDYATGVLNHLEELRTHVPNNSKTPWILQLDWKRMKEKELVGLIQALECFQVEFADYPLEPETKWFLEDLYHQLYRTRKRMLGAKHLNFSFSPDQLDELYQTREHEYLPSVREYGGNFLINVTEVLKRLFRIRFQKRVKTTRTQRVRGYRDKGSESSLSERARRAANTDTWNEYLEQVFQYCQLTGCHPRQALRIFNMEPGAG
jgi:DNA-binding transcriptional regulator YhcF (GntR family)